MTILVVLVSLLVSHLVPGVRGVRRFDGLLWLAEQVEARVNLPSWGWTALIVIIAVVVGAVISALGQGLLGPLGWFVIAVLVLVLCLGPRDLDVDVQAMLDDPNSDAADEARVALNIRPDDDGDMAAAAVFNGALARWFGAIFWFVILGIPGALLYRLTRVSVLHSALDEARRDHLLRLRTVLDAPVIALIGLGLALTADFDRIVQAWVQYRRDREPGDLISGLPQAALLTRMASTLVSPGVALPVGLRSGHHLIWRVLILWLVVLSILMLAGWLS